MEQVNQLRLSKGYHTLIDEDEFDRLSAFKWTAFVTKSHVYAGRRERMIDGSRKLVFLHRMLTLAPDGFDVDHINGDTLDNRKVNLRIARRHQNGVNSVTIRGVVPLRGVSIDRKSGRYRAFLKLRGKSQSLGFFDTPEEAAKAYELAREIYGGEFYPNR